MTLLAADLPRMSPYASPPGASPDELAHALDRVLAGQSCPVIQVMPPTIEIAQLLDRADDRLITFLELLGPEAVTADPTLPARLRHLRHDLAPLTSSQLRLLSIRVPLVGEGRSEGGSGGHGHTGVTRHGTIDALMLTQLALPPLALAIRRSRDELLYRTRGGSPPPAPNALVLILDDTAAAHGEVGVTLRLIAHLLAVNVISKGRRCALVTLGEPTTDVLLSRPEDLIRIWTAGTDKAPDPGMALRLADALASRFSATTADETRVVTLTHAFQPALPHPGGVTVRVHYPGQPIIREGPSAIMVSPSPAAAELARVVAWVIS